MSEALEVIARSVRSGEPYEEELVLLQTTLQDTPAGTYFSAALRGELIQVVDHHLAKTETPPARGFLSSDVLMRSMNAIELDWRAPAVGPKNVPLGRYVGVDLDGVLGRGCGTS